MRCERSEHPDLAEWLGRAQTDRIAIKVEGHGADQRQDLRSSRVPLRFAFESYERFCPIALPGMSACKEVGVSLFPDIKIRFRKIAGRAQRPRMPSCGTPTPRQ